VNASAFDEENGVLHPPPGMSVDDCTVLSVCRTRTQDGTPIVISCWKPTPEEWAEMKRTGRVWLYVWGQTMPPVALSGHDPFKPSPENPE
jgi:hypothetical protein